MSIHPAILVCPTCKAKPSKALFNNAPAAGGWRFTKIWEPLERFKRDFSHLQL
jgi:hypothetical protein